MRDAQQSLQNRGAHVAIIGNGQPMHARMFAEDERVPFTLWVDPEMNAYRAAGLRRGMRAVLSRRSAGHMARAMRSGFRQSKTQGDPWQLGGVFVIDPQGRSWFEHHSREAGDHAATDEILAALDRAAAA